MEVEAAIHVGKGSVFFLLAVETGLSSAVLFVVLMPTGVVAPFLGLGVGLLLTGLFANSAKRHFDVARGIKREPPVADRPAAAPDLFVE